MRKFADRGKLLTFEPIDGAGAAQVRAAQWRDSAAICALADDQRHLGHIVRAGSRWLVFDATHCDKAGTGFRLLGTALNITEAKQAVERSLNISCERLM